MDVSTSQPAAAAVGGALPNLRVARFEDYADIERLERSHGLQTLSERDWLGIWQDHPLGERLGNEWPIGWVLENSAGAIVGSLGNVVTQYVFRGRDLIAATGRAWVVDEQYRGYALWLIDEYFNQAGIDLFINTTVNGMAVDPFTAFGSKRVPLGDWNRAAYWITGYYGFARAALSVKKAPMRRVLALPLAAALCVKDTLSNRAIRSSDSISVEFQNSFDERFDRFWEELLQSRPGMLLGVRDSRTLSWHFASPLRRGEVWILSASRGGQLRAYAIIKRQDHPPAGLVRMRLVDFQSIDSDDVMPAILNAALARCRTEEIHTFEHVGCDLPKMHAFDAHAPYRRALPAWPFYFHTPDAALAAELTQAAKWDASSYDGDASL